MKTEKSPVTSTTIEAVAFIGIDNPPVNAISAGKGVVAALARAFAVAAADAGVEAIVLYGEGGRFSAGADIGDFGEDPAIVTPIRDLIAAIDRIEKPVIALLQGIAFGGGLELALAAHVRLATPETVLAFPEVELGLLPGAGGTQRLPRLTGIDFALDMIGSGRRVAAAEALAAGLVDRIATGDPRAEALAVARSLGGTPPRRTRGLPVRDAKSAAWFAEQRAVESGRKRPSVARGNILDCLEAAAALPFDAGLAVEHRLFDALMLSEPSRGLRHVFAATRRAGALPGLAKGTQVLPVATTAVIGAGTMGTGISAALLAAGLPVTLVDAKPEALAAAGRRIAAIFARDVEKGRIDRAEMEARIGRLTTAADLAATADADLVIEAVFEEMNVKRQVFEALDAIAKPSAILASNTSTLDLDAIAAITARPGSVVGLHFFSPANVMRLMEVVRGAKTRPEILATAMAFAKRIGKVAVVSGVTDGFIGNRIFEEELRQAYFLLEEGALPAEIDTALEQWGMAMGPLRVMDLAGLDIGWSIRKRRRISDPGRPYSAIPDRICEGGRFGQKTGAGFYAYPDGRTAKDDPEIEALIVGFSKEIGIARRSVPAQEMVERCLFAMVNEGAKIVAEGVAYRPSDIDVVYVNGYGFPGTRGGPMFFADRCGLAYVLDRIRTFAAGRNGWAFEPAPLLEQLVREGRTFGSMNA